VYRRFYNRQDSIRRRPVLWQKFGTNRSGQAFLSLLTHERHAMQTIIPRGNGITGSEVLSSLVRVGNG